MLALLLLAPALVLATPTSLRTRQSQSGVLIRAGDGSGCLSFGEGGTQTLLGDVALSTTCDNSGPQPVYMGSKAPIQRRSWDIVIGASSVIKATGTNYCLSTTGDGKTNNAGLKIEECSSSSTQWFATSDQHIAVTGGNQCIDIARLVNSIGERYTQPQTYQCIGDNTNQIFTYPQDTGAPLPSATATAVSTTAPVASATATSTTPAPSSNGVYIHPNGDNSVCLTVKDGAQSGDIVTTARCNTSNGVQHRFDISRGDGLIRLSDSNLCLDAGSNPSNGVGMKVWQCYPGLSQQQWYYTDDNRIAITGGNQCLDLTDGVKDINAPKQAQTYACSTGNTNQIWTTNLINYVQ